MVDSTESPWGRLWGVLEDLVRGYDFHSRQNYFRDFSRIYRLLWKRLREVPDAKSKLRDALNALLDPISIRDARELSSAGFVELAVDVKLRGLVSERHAKRQTFKGLVDASTNGKKTRKRGRPPDTDPQEDRRIWEAWSTRRYKTFENLAVEHGKTKDFVRRAVDRHRKRLRKNSPE